MTELRPAVGTKITNCGIVTGHVETAYGLRVLTVERTDAYPPLGPWCQMVDGRLVSHNYLERSEGRIFTGILKIYWKE